MYVLGVCVYVRVLGVVCVRVRASGAVCACGDGGRGGGVVIQKLPPEQRRSDGSRIPPPPPKKKTTTKKTTLLRPDYCNGEKKTTTHCRTQLNCFVDRYKLISRDGMSPVYSP